MDKVRVYEILTVLVVCLKVKLFVRNYKSNSKVTYCEIFGKCRKVEKQSLTKFTEEHKIIAVQME